MSPWQPWCNKSSNRSSPGLKSSVVAWHNGVHQALLYREHLTRTAAKLKSHNNLMTKLAGTSWGACASTLARQLWLFPTQLQTTATQLHQFHRYSTSQFHAPDFRLPAFHSGLVASGTQWCGSTIISPQSSKRQDASDHWSPSKLACLCWCVRTST